MHYNVLEDIRIQKSEHNDMHGSYIHPVFQRELSSAPLSPISREESRRSRWWVRWRGWWEIHSSVHRMRMPKIAKNIPPHFGGIFYYQYICLYKYLVFLKESQDVQWTSFSSESFTTYRARISLHTLSIIQLKYGLCGLFLHSYSTTNSTK